ncbi:hypothetical protein HII31_11603 [Pseudocercospora fuligena]|uniref:Myb-like domain-containing protein n=1 Tax=Pseudocercospora fuligena TaxID=685502 RepID=A0A8H6R9Q4_9PEZI|nr:hypothetical protein HII31_11603 [Pseudocercospora fuligena]
MPPASIPGGWNDTLDKKLLLGIVAQVGFGNIKWDQIAALLGDNVPASAVAQRFSRIRTQVKAADRGSPTPKTPGKGGAKKNGSTGKRKAAKDEEDGDDDEEEKTPTAKKAKKEVVKKESIEDAEDDDDGLV